MKNRIVHPVVGKKAPDFTLESDRGGTVMLSQLCRSGPVLLVFYPWDFTPVCTSQLCDYRDSFAQLTQFGVQIVGISGDVLDSHRLFSRKHQLPFPLLSDPGKVVARCFGCASVFMFGMMSRALFIIGRDMTILYRKVEPTVLSRPKSDALIGVLSGLKSSAQI